MKLILIRHGETPANVAGELDTAVPGPGLTERGMEQAAALVDRFRGVDFDVIYASTHTRAQLTAAPLAADRATEVLIRSGFREFSVGALEKRSDPEALSIFIETVKRWILGDTELSMAGGESAADIVRRFDAEIAEVAATGVQTAVIVSHGGALRIWAAARANNIDTDFALANYLVNTAVVILEGNPQQGWHCASWDLAPEHH
ncbi:histidine phosphatase family protein [Nakamurella antarctica]|uniref:Histidine phosphatase family protein n=1 Tax=Nakamurella antarctica TaxID=1902245 RepID=A0A3G8ZI32_9ACTN|nr:histidine phosphatase family protein [Nakamurella antarctica]AZI57039.1 histidine phosphatase family protein [Nakamurella antarctica]